MYNLPVQSIRSLCLKKSKKQIGIKKSYQCYYKKMIIKFKDKKSIDFF